MRLQGLASVGFLGIAITTTTLAGPGVAPGQSASLTRPTVHTEQAGQIALRSLPRDRRATSGTSTGNGAIVVQDFPCGVPVPGSVIISAPVSHSVATPSGNVAIQCHAKTQITPPQAIVVMDVPCATLNGSGTDSHVVLTPSGRVNFWCHRHR